MKNKQAKRMICDVEVFKRNGIVPNQTTYHFKGGEFGCTFLMRSGWFFRGAYSGVVSLTADQLRGLDGNH